MTLACDVPSRGRSSSSGKPIKLIGEFNLKYVFGFANESENGTDIYIILTYSYMLNVGY